MNKVITINLNGRAYQLEEEGYGLLKDYLDDATQKLEENPGKDEILADFEQAIAEKCDQYVGSMKTVVTTADVKTIIEQMGPVESGTAEKKEKKYDHKKLYQIREGAMIAGVCKGLAVYFGVDVVIVRVIFVVLGLLTHGVMVLLYLVMMFIVPVAETSEEKAQAFGQPFNAHEVLERARKNYEKYGNRTYWKEQKKQWKKNYYENRASYQYGVKDYGYSPVVAPMLGVFMGVVSLLWVIALLSVISTGALFGWNWPAFIPLWVMIVILGLLYNLVLSPIRGIRYHQQAKHSDGWLETINGVAWIALFVLLGWVVYQFVPGSHVIFDKLQSWWYSFADYISSLF